MRVDFELLDSRNNSPLNYETSKTNQTRFGLSEIKPTLNYEASKTNQTRVDLS